MSITPISPRDTLPLRQSLLRPHQTPEECIYPGDDDPTTIHLGAIIDNKLAGIVSLYRDALPDAGPGLGFRFRALAIEAHLRGKGFGSALLAAVEALAQDEGADYLWANARITALAFYQKAGYSIGEVEFMVAGVGPHRVIRRDFTR